MTVSLWAMESTVLTSILAGWATSLIHLSGAVLGEWGGMVLAFIPSLVPYLSHSDLTLSEGEHTGLPSLLHPVL